MLLIKLVFYIIFLKNSSHIYHLMLGYSFLQLVLAIPLIDHSQAASQTLNYGRRKSGLQTKMENLCIVLTMVLLFSYFLLNRIWPLQLWPSCFAKVIFLLGSTLIRNLLIIYHLFCFVRILCGYLWMHIERSQSVIYPIYKEYVPLYKI